MIFDSDVLIWALRQNISALKAIDAAELRCLSVVSRMELLQGLRDKRELGLLQQFLSEFVPLQLSEAIGLRAVSCMEAVALKVQLSPIDAMIAATAMEAGLPVCTGNVKHFRHVKGLELVPFRPHD